MRRFSLTVRFGKTRRPSGTMVMPRATIWSGGRPTMFFPSKVMEACFGLTRPATAFMVVDLPAPLAPIRVTIFPCSMSMSMPLTASMPP